MHKPNRRKYTPSLARGHFMRSFLKVLAMHGQTTSEALSVMELLECWKKYNTRSRLSPDKIKSHSIYAIKLLKSFDENQQVFKSPDDIRILIRPGMHEHVLKYLEMMHTNNHHYYTDERFENLVKYCLKQSRQQPIRKRRRLNRQESQQSEARADQENSPQVPVPVTTSYQKMTASMQNAPSKEAPVLLSPGDSSSGDESTHMPIDQLTALLEFMRNPDYKKDNKDNYDEITPEDVNDLFSVLNNILEPDDQDVNQFPIWTGKI